MFFKHIYTHKIFKSYQYEHGFLFEEKKLLHFIKGMIENTKICECVCALYGSCA